jgi:hypothetical protein
MEILILSVLLILSLLWAFSSMGLVGSNKKIELPSFGFVIIGEWNDALDERLRMFVANQHRVCHMTHWKNIDSIKKHGLLVKTPPGAGGMDAGLGISPEEARLKYATGIHVEVGRWMAGDSEIGSLPIGITNDYAHNLAESAGINQHIILERDIPSKDLLIPRSKELFDSDFYTVLKERFGKLIHSRKVLSKGKPRKNWKEYFEAEEFVKQYRNDGFGVFSPMTNRINDYLRFSNLMDVIFNYYTDRNDWFKTNREHEYNDFIKIKDNPEFIKLREYMKLVSSVKDMGLSKFLLIFLGDLITIRKIPRIRKKSKRNITETEELGDSVDWS